MRRLLKPCFKSPNLYLVAVAGNFSKNWDQKIYLLYGIARCPHLGGYQTMEISGSSIGTITICALEHGGHN